MHNSAAGDEHLAAGSPSSTEDSLRSLFINPDPGIRRSVAEHPEVPEELLVALSHDRNNQVKIAVCRNQSTPGYLIEKLAGDPLVAVRIGIAALVHLPSKFLKKLAKDENPQVKVRAKHSLQAQELERALAEIGFDKAPSNPVHDQRIEPEPEHKHEPEADHVYHRAKLGSLLVEAGLITSDQLLESLLRSKLYEVPLGQAVVQQGLVSQQTVVLALNCQLQVRQGRLPLEKAIAQLRAARKSEFTI